MRLRYLTGALHDLQLIHEYIARDNPVAARRVITAIRQESQSLTQHPHVGKPGQVEGTREQVHSRYPYIIAYRVQNKEIQILGIVHSSRKWPEDF
ncbi:MAG: type II toxin-antitoxin system RelE/ParE family toxin [Sideroxyarcus sp.]|nr:type II toxin-antitoxin system RelE/ParE family toxin [Sideroxyarcus sp.]